MEDQNNKEIVTKRKYLMSRSIYRKVMDPKQYGGRKGIIDVVERYTNGGFRVITYEFDEEYTGELNSDNTNDEYYNMNGFEKIAERVWVLGKGKKTCGRLADEQVKDQYEDD